LRLKSSPIDVCQSTSAHHKKLIGSTVLELYCAYCTLEFNDQPLAP
jgi:hypothetical protein